jgi:TfoX/Sxy family transcriptional regulator of competence genes
LEKKKMFGGVGFLVNGNMACGVHKNNMIVRVGPEKHAWALAQPHTRPFDMTGRPMSGWVEVEPPGCTSESALKAWVDLGLAFALSLPGK